MSDFIKAEFLFDSQYQFDVENNFIKGCFLDYQKNNKTAFSIEDNNSFIKADISEWDTNHFGIKMAKVHSYFTSETNSKACSKLVNWSQENSVKHLSFRTNINNRISLDSFYENRFEVMANKYMLRLVPKWFANINSIQELKNSNSLNIKKLKEIAKNSFNHGKFINDQYIPEEKAKGIYKQWLLNSLESNLYETYTHIVGGEIVGFVLYSVGHGYHSKLNQEFPHGFIWLIATDKKFKGKGYGKTMLNIVAKSIFERGCNVIYANTDSENLLALNMFQSVGFRTFNILQEIRLWLK